MDIGRLGEAIAARFLIEQGCSILARNWRPQHPLRGELDIVAEHGSKVRIVEVKTRTGTSHGAPVEAVTFRKAAALRSLSAAWLAQSGTHVKELRIDVASVLIELDESRSRVLTAAIDYLEGIE